MKNFLPAILILASLLACQSQSRTNVVAAAKTDTTHHESFFAPLADKEKKRLHDEVEAVLTQSLYRTAFNGAVLIAKNGTIVYEKYQGFHDLKLKDSITTETPFQIASTSKTLTAGAVLKLVEEGKLGLNDSLSKFFPQLPYPGITVKMLLNHRSGLPNYLNYMDKSVWPHTKEATNADVLKTLIEWEPMRQYAPGRHFSYCNTNFVLLALIIEQVSGQTYPDYMKQHVFEPLGMSHTFVRKTNDPLVTQSYQYNGAPWTLDFSDGPYGDKNIYSTPQDLLKWDQALYGGNFLSKQMLDSAFTPYSNERPGVRNYGLGWRMLLLPNGKKVIFHNGHWHGFNSAFARLTEAGATIIILGNRYNKSIYTTAKKLFEVFGDYDGKHDEGEE